MTAGFGPSRSRPIQRSQAVALIESALGVPPGSLSEETALGSVRNWDSVGRLSVLAAVEESLGVIASPRGLAGAVRVADILDLLGEGLE